MKDWPGAQLAARGVLLVGPLLALLPAPGSLPVWAGLLAVVVGVLAAREPDGYAGLLAIVLTLAVWAIAPGHGLPATVMISAAILAIIHVCGVLASYGPAQMALERELLARWGRRTLGLIAAAAVVFGLSRLVETAGPSSIGWGAGVGAAVLLVLLARASLVDSRD